MLLANALKSSIAPPKLPSPLHFRSISPDDIETLGKLYFSSYEPGEACESLEESINDIKASFAGEYGVLWPEVSLAVFDQDCMIGAIMVVRQNSWDREIAGPFIIELFSDLNHRRQGIARFLVQESCKRLFTLKQREVFLNVVDTNTAAMQLYKGLGFNEVHQEKKEDK
jgi:GNAT superfamily N-acetyltransferase